MHGLIAYGPFCFSYVAPLLRAHKQIPTRVTLSCAKIVFEIVCHYTDVKRACGVMLPVLEIVIEEFDHHDLVGDEKAALALRFLKLAASVIENEKPAGIHEMYKLIDRASAMGGDPLARPQSEDEWQNFSAELSTAARVLKKRWNW